MRYGNDYGPARGYFRARGYDPYFRRDFVDRPGPARGYGYRGPEEPRGRGWDADRAERERERGGHRFFGRWANRGEDDTWESDRHWPRGYGRPPARMASRGRGYGADYGAGRGWTGGRARGYDRG